MRIGIKEPCGENLETMKPTNCGRFCLTCSKEVIDFRYFTDEELISFFKDSKNKNVCGSFLPSQLNRDIYEKRQNHVRFSFSNYIYSILLSFILYIQSGCKKTENITSKTYYGYFSLIDGYPVQQFDYSYEIKNKSKSDTKKTNEFGEFKLEIPSNSLNDTLILNYFGTVKKIFPHYELYSEGTDTLILSNYQNNELQIKVYPELGAPNVLGMPNLDFYTENPKNYLNSINWLERFFPPQVRQFFTKN